MNLTRRIHNETRNQQSAPHGNDCHGSPKLQILKFSFHDGKVKNRFRERSVEIFFAIIV